jgi:hypothetical protein
MLRLLSVLTALALFLGCEEPTSCDRFADYICTCHEGDPGYDCEALLDLAADPTVSTDDQCALDLKDQKDLDREDGLECEV